MPTRSSDKPPSPAAIAVNAILFVIHLVVGTIGVTFAAAVQTYSVMLFLHPFFPSLGSRTVHWILTETPYFPVQILGGLLCGFLLGRRYSHQVMLWIWIVPAMGIALMLLFAPLQSIIVSGVEISKTEHFFGWDCLPQNHCFYQVGLTLPFYTASAYSLGALVARTFTRSRRQAPAESGSR